MARSVRWRPQVLWAPMGLLLGAMSGAVMGIVLLLGAVVVEPVLTGSRAEGGSWWEGFVLVVVGGAWFGGIAGLVVGFVVGLEMVFLVGSHLPREVARRRAYVLGLVLPPVTMVGPWALADGLSLSLSGGEDLWWLLVLGGASLLGSRQARWLAGLAAPDAEVS